MEHNQQHIESKDLTYRGETNTGQEFGGLVIASVECKRQFIRILFDQHGNPATRGKNVAALSNFFGFRFTPAFLDGEPCLINIEDL